MTSWRRALKDILWSYRISFNSYVKSREEHDNIFVAENLNITSLIDIQLGVLYKKKKY